MQSFYIDTNLFNYLGCGNILSIHTILTILLIKIIFNSNKLSNSSRFYSKSTKYLQIPLYNLKLKLLLSFNFNIIIIKYTIVIIAFLINVRLFNSLG